MRLPLLALALLALPFTGSAALVAPPAAEGGGPYNGLDAWNPGMGYWAPITRGFAFVEGRGVLFHSLDPVLMPTDENLGRIYQFPNCPGLRPVLSDDTPLTDSPMRQVIDVVLADCVQPRSDVEIFTVAGVLHQQRRQMFVNAPIVPAPYASWQDDALFNGPPFRPRVGGFFDGQEVRFITYDVSWLPPWLGTAFPGHNVDLFILSGDAIFTPGETLLSLFNGAPLDLRPPPLPPALPSPDLRAGTHRAYSPVWAAKCLAPVEDLRCGALRGPAFGQCTRIFECTSIEGVTFFEAPFRFVNCPIVNTDVDDDGFLSQGEEFAFPDLWKDRGWVSVF